ncbi:MULTISPECIES: barstar family protein [unclassified Clostridium]|uniref:barstar family protein n=1 Tax=unclassified Clostridium TaxID=2614128 RepID=UPI000298132C|nr:MULTISPECIES: barstar family protein [unclassified Clostridium]EKQ54396.1 MAG: Barstar, RNAse (barnase) inhibitor [Clostridium sp. Maddingley MBC34-26]
MNKVVIQGSKLTDKNILHQILKQELKLPAHYGENLDALWDCLTADIQLPVIIEWVDFQKSKDLLGDYAENTLEIFNEAEKFTGGKLNIIINN